MSPETSAISAAGILQLLGLAVIAAMVIFLGIKIATGGAKGFAFAMTEIVGLIVAAAFIMRPNDVIGMFIKVVGGVQTVSLPK
jgi:hypothetical protein